MEPQRLELAPLLLPLSEFVLLAHGQERIMKPWTGNKA